MNNAVGMVLGAIFEHKVVLYDLGRSGWDFQTYAIAPDKPSSDRIPDSAFSSPARYIQEMFLRISESQTQSCRQLCFVFNPLFATTRASILTTVAALRSMKELSGPVVVSDSDGLPVGYLLPSHFDIGDARYLALLSTVDSTLDAAFLEHLCFSKTHVVQIARLRLSRHGRNGFDDHGMTPVYKWITQRAISEFQVITDSIPRNIDPAFARARRDAIPFTAIMPNHAGDVLFFALAFNQITSPYRGIAVNRAFVDIVRDAAPSLATVAIDTPQLNRDSAFAAGKAVRDNDYFQTYKDSLPQGSFYTYCRPSRNYNATDFHLIDHFGFALGYSPREESALLIQTRPLSPRLTVPHTANAPARVLLHFDAGWPLKVYPPAMQSELIELLRSRGHEVTVLAPPGYSHHGIKSTTFTSLSAFVALARTHDVIVGMDSFPCHYCVHVLGLPTLCLFANTKPANSNALPSGNYSFLEKRLSCRPCYAIVRCPVYGGTECRNFAAPTVVVDQIEVLLIGASPLPAAKRAASTEAASSLSTMNIHIRFVAFQALIASFIPSTSYWTSLVAEFFSAIHREGLLAAIRRSGRFLARKFRALS